MTDGTLILVDEPMRSLAWHHSVEFDGSVHSTACGRTIDVEHVRDVEREQPWRSTVPPVDGCGQCSGYVPEAEREEAT